MNLSIATLFFLLTYEAHTEAVPTYAGVGCFRDRGEPLNRTMRLLASYRNPPNITMDWYDLENTVVKKCAKEAAKTQYKFFGIQFYGECWGGGGKYDKWGKSTNCEETGNAFVGKHLANFVYMLTGDECSPETYTVLDDPTRARTYSGPYRRSPCDFFTVAGWKAGWKRFDGAAGSIMANSCVPYKHCGTEKPGWFNGTLPKVEEGERRGSVCFSDRNSCCSSFLTIKVRNCGKFYVYRLPGSPNGCPKAYCGNGKYSTTVTTGRQGHDTCV